MKDTDIVGIADWLVGRGLAGVAEEDLLREFCEKCRAAGLEVSRSLALIDTLHPVHEGSVFRWRDDESDDAASTSRRLARRSCAGASASAKPPISRPSRR